MGNNLRFSTNRFDVFNPAPKQWKYNSLFDLCMAYLKGEFIPKEEFFIKEKES